jgi:hypothetical protein
LNEFAAAFSSREGTVAAADHDAHEQEKSLYV